MEIEERDVVNLWMRMSRKYKTSIKNKDKSKKMKRFAWLLSRFKVMSKKEFARFSITLKKVIYISFQPGGPLKKGESYESRICTCVHEHDHAIHPLSYWRYLTNKNYRARKETKAYKCNIAMRWYMSGYKEPDIRVYLKYLKSYKLKDKHLRKAELSFKALVSQLMRHDLTGVPSVAREAMRVLK